MLNAPLPTHHNPSPAAKWQCRTVEWHRPWAWLEQGIKDLLRTPALSLLHGAALVAAAWLIVAMGWRSAALMAGAFSGFLLIAPVLALGLYELSRQAAAQREPRWADAVRVWRRVGHAPWRIGLGLAVAGTVWVVLTLAVWWVAWRVSIRQVDSLGTSVPFWGWQGFATAAHWRTGLQGPVGAVAVLWVMAGGLLASLVFAATAVSLPLLVGLDVGEGPRSGAAGSTIKARDAVLLSIEAVARNPVTMALWALLILLTTALGVATGFGLAVLWPVLGHATWHAARDVLVPPSQGPFRLTPHADVN